MASYHVWGCDECGQEIKTHNDYECLKIPQGWSTKVSEQGLSCRNCTAQLTLLNAAFEKPTPIR